MGTNSAVDISAFRNAKPAAAFGPATQVESLADGIGSSYGVIGYRGKNWTLRYRGEIHLFVRPDEPETPLNYIDVVILRQNQALSKTYYAAGYVQGQDGKRPDCTSIDSVRPDPDAAHPQAPACTLCPRNEWRQGANGKKERECADSKRLAVLLLPGMTQSLLGQPLIEPVFLRVPPGTLNDLATFGESMGSQGWQYWTFVTRISFDPALAHPKFQFRATVALTDAEAPTILELREGAAAKRITGEGQVARAALAPPAAAPQLAPAPAPAAGIGLVVPRQPVMIEAQANPAPVAPSAPALGGFVAAPAPTVVATVAAVSQTDEDTGMQTTGDADLDARIAKLIAEA